MNIQLGRYFELPLHNLCPRCESPIFGDFVNPWNIYEDLQDPVVLRKYLENQMEEYNVSPGVVRMDLVLFRDAVVHICRIVRVISQPRGHMLLVGIGKIITILSINSYDNFTKNPPIHKIEYVRTSYQCWVKND